MRFSSDFRFRDPSRVGSRHGRFLLGLALLAFLVPGGRVLAQENSVSAADSAPGSLTVANKRYDAEKELSRMTRRYELSEDQRARIQPILLDQQKQIHALGEDESLSDAAWASAVRKVHEQTVQKIKLQLTDSQLTKYMKDETKLAKHSSSSDGDDDGPPDGPPPGGGPGGPGGGGSPPGD